MRKSKDYKGDKCIDCGIDITIKSTSGRCQRCSFIARPVKPVKKRRGKHIKCKQCDKEFYRSPSTILGAKYCSYKCHADSQRNKIKRICKECNKRYETHPSQVKHRGSNYCSKECRAKGVGKQKAGKIVSEVWSLRKADRIFSEFIRTRDNWTCRYCKKNFKDRPIQLHNSHFWSRKYASTRFDPDNCIALCAGCHLFNLEREKQGIYRDIMIEWLGEEKYKELEKKKNVIVKRVDAIRELMDFIQPHLKALNYINSNTGRREQENEYQTQEFLETMEQLDKQKK